LSALATAGVELENLVARAVTAGTPPAGESWREGLGVFLADLARSRTMRPGAREATEAFVVATLRARFAMEAWHAAHPAAAASPVTRPLIVLGMPRAGTTFLVNLFSLDPQRRMHWHWEGNRELPPAEAVHLHDDPRIAMRVGEVEALIENGFLPLNHHVERGDEPTECFWQMQQDFKSFSLLIHTQVPDYFEWWLHHADMTAAYAYHRRYLQALQSAAPGAWTLKFPSHALAIAEIIATYPDSLIVYTHRDPIKPVGSTCSLNAHPLSMTNSDVDLAMVGYQVSGILAASAQRMIAARDRHSDHAFHDIHYRDFVRDPMATIRALYAFQGLELSDVVARAMQAAIARHDGARSDAAPHVYRLADYGLDEAAIDRLFGDYIARFDIALERL